MDIAMIASLMRRITGIPSSVSGRFRGTGKWFRHAYGLPNPMSHGAILKDVQKSAEAADRSRPVARPRRGKIP
jgi:hypothetical protein